MGICMVAIGHPASQAIRVFCNMIFSSPDGDVGIARQPITIEEKGQSPTSHHWSLIVMGFSL